MDLLAKRYASPFLILDEFIRLHQLHEFTVEIIKTIADEKVQEMQWQFYLHKVYGKSWGDFLKTCEQPKEEEISQEQIKTTIDDSKNMLEGFIPS
jgi:hypothetical protein